MQANPDMQQDVKTLTLSPNPAPQSSEPSSSDTERPQFVCPLTLKEMNGAQPFVYLSTCGCVFSQAGLKTVSASSTPQDRENDKGKAKAATTDPSDAELELCPQCGKKYSQTEDVVLLNPSQDEEDAMREVMERKRLLEPVKKPKSSKKRKNDSPADDAAYPVKKQAAVRPSAKISAASQAVVSGLAMEEAKRKSEMSDAVKSLYGNGTKRKETFMTMNTFTRVRLPSDFDFIFNPDSLLTVRLIACFYTTRQCATTWNSFYTLSGSQIRACIEDVNFSHVCSDQVYFVHFKPLMG
jgi:transcriptional regulator NrdR family protein